MPSLQKNKAVSPRRYRTLGMMIAIIATAFIYGIIPLLPAGMTAIVTLEGHHLAGADLPFNPLDVLASILVLIICVMAWIGRPRWIRWILILSVWLATAYDFERLYQSLQPRPITQGLSGGSITEFAQSAVPCVVILLVLVPLYITWYMNRAPARAFYRHDE